MTLKVCPLEHCPIRNIFMEKSCRKCTKLVLDPFLILVNNLKQLLYARNFLKNKIFKKRIIKKP